MTSFIKIPGKDPVLYLITDMNKTRHVIKMLGKTRLELNNILEKYNFKLRKGKITFRYEHIQQPNWETECNHTDILLNSGWILWNICTKKVFFSSSAEWEIAPESYAQNLVKSSEQSELERVERVLKEKAEQRKREAEKNEL